MGGLGLDIFHPGGIVVSFTLFTIFILVMHYHDSETISHHSFVLLVFQSQFPDVDDNEIKEMDMKISQLTELVKQNQEENRKLDSGT